MFTKNPEKILSIFYIKKRNKIFLDVFVLANKNSPFSLFCFVFSCCFFSLERIELESNNVNIFWVFKKKINKKTSYFHI